ncbi:expressed protein [Phakopsora pachyrhizi]|uniref:Expressed protein n=1 Tax=Phakopsora pachyrhizi TaxID=170000 RepID=A0AAV0APR9_PHAPC|nr:expressed protein [Phakopsora pachyrhizi]
MQRKFLYKMFTLQLFSIFCLSLHLILRYRGVQGAFHIASFGEEGEYLSHDSVSVNRKDFSKFNQNINYDKHNYMVPPTNPSSRVFSKPIAGEHTNLEAEDISLPYESDNPFNSPESVIQIGSHQVIQTGEVCCPNLTT